MAPALLRRQWTVRAYLLLLVLGVALPLVGLLGTILYWSAIEDEKQATEMALQLSRLAATESAAMVTDTRSLLSRLAERSQVKAMDARNCDDMLDQYLQ